MIEGPWWPLSEKFQGSGEDRGRSRGAEGIMGGEEVGAEEQRLYFQEVWLKRNQKKWESG